MAQKASKKPIKTEMFDETIEEPKTLDPPSSPMAQIEQSTSQMELNEEVSDAESQASNLSGMSERTLDKIQNMGGKSDFDQIAMDQIINSVVDKLSTTLQSLCVSERVVQAQQTAQDWQDICRLMVANPEIINEKLSVNRGPSTVFKKIGVDMTDPSKASLSQFLASPLSSSIWRIMIIFELNQDDPIFDKWWKKVKTDHKDPWGKLSKYLQAAAYFVNVADNLWTELSINPTSMSAQKIITHLTVLGDWIRSGKTKRLNS